MTPAKLARLLAPLVLPLALGSCAEGATGPGAREPAPPAVYRWSDPAS